MRNHDELGDDLWIYNRLRRAAVDTMWITTSPTDSVISMGMSGGCGFNLVRNPVTTPNLLQEDKGDDRRGETV